MGFFMDVLQFKELKNEADSLVNANLVFTKNAELATAMVMCGFKLKPTKDDYVVEYQNGKREYAFTFLPSSTDIGLDKPVTPKGLFSIIYQIGGMENFIQQYPDSTITPLFAFIVNKKVVEKAMNEAKTVAVFSTIDKDANSTHDCIVTKGGAKYNQLKSLKIQEL